MYQTVYLLKCSASSDPHRDKLFCHSFWHLFWKYTRHITVIFSDETHIEMFCHSILAFYLASILTSNLASFLASMLTSYLASYLASVYIYIYNYIYIYIIFILYLQALATALRSVCFLAFTF